MPNVGDQFRFSVRPREYDGASAQELVAILERRDRDIEDYLSDLSAPGGGGGDGAVYGSYEELSWSGGENGTKTGSGISIGISETSTVAVSFVAQVSGTDDYTLVGAWVAVDDGSGTRITWPNNVPAVQVVIGSAFNATGVSQGVITLDPGSYTFEQKVNISGGSFGRAAQCLLNIVVGGNTGSDSFI